MSKDRIGQLDLNLIFVFDALLRYQSVTRAATSLNLTQGAVSHSLKRLRVFFADPLFSRGVGGVVPTPRAIELSHTVCEIAGLVRKGLLSEARFEPESAGRTFTICMSDLGELTVLPSLIAAVRKESPQSTVHTLHAQIADVHALLESGEADLAISGYPPGNVEIYQQKLFARSSIVLANRRVHGGEELSLETYCQAAHVAIVPVLGGISAVDQVLAKHKLQRNVVVTTQHHLVIPFLLDGDPSLIATVPQDMAPAWRRHEDLRSFPLPFEFPSFEVSQFWHGRFHTDRTHVWFRKLVAECFQSASPGGVPRFQPDEIMSGANNDD